MKKIREDYLKIINANPSGCADDFKDARENMRRSSAVFPKGQLRFLCVPKMFTEEAYERIAAAMELTACILEKVIEKYLTDTEYRKLFPFSKRLEELILLPAGYERKLPIARLDIFFNEDDFSFKFCEFNADGASAMNEDREIANAWSKSKLWAEFGKKYNMQFFELFESWVTEFLKLYAEFSGRKEKPRVAIVDFLELGTKSEFSVFKEAFERRGVETEICEITALEYRSGKLFSCSGKSIDAVYRRAVTSECMERYGQITGFLDAVKNNAVCLIGAFRTQVIHDKNIFRILRLQKTKEFLTEEENAFVEKHIPVTCKLENGEFDIEDVIRNKDKWLIKPADRYASAGVAAGADYPAETFERIIRSAAGKGYVLQEYCNPFKTENLFCDKAGRIRRALYNNMTGIFMYNGKAAGFYARSMTKNVTTKRNEGRVACSLLVTKKNGD